MSVSITRILCVPYLTIPILVVGAEGWCRGVPSSLPIIVALAVLLTAEVKHLVPMMDTGQTQKVSKQEFLNSMPAEFDRLDKDKIGELDVKELTQLPLSPGQPPIGW
jgi:hypothetical protein